METTNKIQTTLDAFRDKDIRLTVCDIIEGRADALNKRYYRISKALK